MDCPLRNINTYFAYNFRSFREPLNATREPQVKIHCIRTQCGWASTQCWNATTGQLYQQRAPQAAYGVGILQLSIPFFA